PGLPGPDEVVAGAAEEDTEDDEDRPEHHEHREEDDRQLAAVRLHAGVLVRIRNRHQTEQTKTRDRHTGDLRLAIAQQLLQTEEVPRRLRRVRREARVRQLTEG